jgi:hypothetical protein
VEKVHKVIHKERKCTINNVCNILGLSYGAYQHFLTEDLNITGKLVSRLPKDNIKKKQLPAKSSQKEQIYLRHYCSQR